MKTYLSQKRGRQARLARAVGVFAPDVSRWADGSRPIPEKYGWPIEVATDGAVTRRELFPETCLSIWPDLAQEEVQPIPRRSATQYFRNFHGTPFVLTWVLELPPYVKRLPA
ncbi:MAG TPA: Cro/CI family transcriptional regulator [Burkholderiaceae bacterium]